MAALNDQANQDKGFIRMQLVERKYMASSGHFAVNSVTSLLSKEKFLIFFQR